MSLGVPELHTVKVMDERLNFDQYHPYAVYKGGKNVSWKPIVSTSFSNSSIQISAPPPNPGVAVDRQVLLNVSYNMFFTCTNNNAGSPPLQLGLFDGPRAFPISQSIDTLAVTLNNTQVSINMSDVFSALVRYMNPGLKRGHSLSFTPSMLDQYQNYQDWQQSLTGGSTVTQGSGRIWSYGGAERNPLAPYGVNTSDDMSRGGFPINVISNANGATGVNCAQVVMSPVEPLFLSPFLFGGEDHNAFIGVQTMDFNITLRSNLGAYLWSHMDSANITGFSVASVSLTNNGNQNVTVQPPQIFFNYITPSDIQKINKVNVYPYFTVDRYPSPIVNLAPQASTTVTSNNIQLKSIPDLVFVYARQQNSDKTPYMSDTFAYINNLSVNWNNNSGLLSSASAYDLYQMSRKNGCDLSWAQWSNYVGSVVCLRMGKDINLGDLECPGLLGTYQLQINASLQNPSYTFTGTYASANNPNYPTSINYVLYIATVSEGIITITENRAITQVGVVSKADVLDAPSTAKFTDADVNKVFYGGDFWSSLKQISRVMKKAHRMGKGVLLGTGEGGKKKGRKPMKKAGEGGKKKGRKPKNRAGEGGKLLNKKLMAKLL